MTARQLIELINRKDFHPLQIYLNDGTIHLVDQPYLVSTSPNSAVFSLYENDLMRIISYRNVTQVVTAVPNADTETPPV